jgi:hypothetical protein
MPKKSLIMIAFVIFPLVVGLACLSSAPDPTATPEPVVETEEAVVEAPTSTSAPVIVEEDEPVEEPMPPAGGVVEGLETMGKSLWFQDGPFVFVAFLFENPSADVLYEDVGFTISLFDENGDLVDEDYQVAPWIFPNQTVGIVSNIWLAMDLIVIDRVGVNWTYSETVSPDAFVNPFTTDSIVYWSKDGYPLTTGKIVNNESTSYTDIQVNLICYDGSGEIVGGGYTFVDFIHLNDFMGFSSYVDTNGEIASVEAFPVLTYSTQFIDKTDFLSEISILDSHFYEDDFGYIAGGFVAKNETNTVLSNSLVYVTFYDQNDNVTATASAYIDLLLPGDTLGISPWVTTPPEGVESKGFDILMLPGVVDENYELDTNPFTVNSTSVISEDEPGVLVNFSNHYSKSVSEVDVFVLVYNAGGQIIGGGKDWTKESTPAGGTGELEVWVVYADGETIASIEAWVVPSFWTVFE